MLRAIEQNTVTIGDLRLPSADTLVWCGGLVTMAAFGVIEWPVAVAIGVGHLLAQDNHVRLLRDFGQALEEA